MHANGDVICDVSGLGSSHKNDRGIGVIALKLGHAHKFNGMDRTTPNHHCPGSRTICDMTAIQRQRPSDLRMAKEGLLQKGACRFSLGCVAESFLQENGFAHYIRSYIFMLQSENLHAIVLMNAKRG